MTTKQPLTAPDAALSRSQTKRYLMVAGWVLWVALVFFVASFTVALVLYVLQKSQLLNVKEIGTAGAFWIDAALYMVMFIIVMWLPWLHWRRTRKGNQPPREKRTESWRFLQKSVGLTRSVRGEDWRYYVAGLPVFYITVLVLSIVAAMIFGDEVMNQTQEIGFAATNNVSELVFIFVALVIVAPLFEEMMMRGFLFGKLREYLSLWPSAVLVSLVFALAHGQINVGIMTFILSMFACRMREKTGVIWAGLFLHMTVNLVAYSVRFLGLGS